MLSDIGGFWNLDNQLNKPPPILKPHLSNQNQEEVNEVKGYISAENNVGLTGRYKCFVNTLNMSTHDIMTKNPKFVSFKISLILI